MTGLTFALARIAINTRFLGEKTVSREEVEESRGKDKGLDLAELTLAAVWKVSHIIPPFCPPPQGGK
jgi:hypothetical protein